LSASRAFTLAIALAIILAGCGPEERLVELRESDQPLLSEPSDFTIVLRGKVVDMDTREEIPDAKGVVVTVTGTYTFTGRFEIRFPAKSVVDLKIIAPGYKTLSTQLKAHYSRNATLDTEIPLERE
jgi:hypothetical protein